jgi:hypothetical protein
MHAPGLFYLTLLPLMALVAACGKGAAEPAKASGGDEQRLMLNQGYSMLYTDASHIDLAKLVLYVKFESEEFNQVLTEISNYGGELKQDLERIAADYPGVRIDLKALPEMETRKRFAIGKDRAIHFLPFSGHGRLEYERTMLIGMSNALNHESHLCGVMAAEEPDPGLKAFLLKSEKRYNDLHELAMNLLNREHFKHNTNLKTSTGLDSNTADNSSRKP